VNYLTKAERETLNAAYDILKGNLTEGEYWTFGWRWFNGHPKPTTDVTMFTAVLDRQVSYLPGDTFADKIEHGMALNAEERAAVPTPEEAKRHRIEALRSQIEALEGKS